MGLSARYKQVGVVDSATEIGGPFELPEASAERAETVSQNMSQNV